jgi:serine/threonine protein kinase
LAYCAPELIAKQDFGPAVDVWSFGMVMYELVYKKLLNTAFAKSVQGGNPPDLPNSPYRGLLLKCWELNPRKRPTFAEIAGLLTDRSKFGDLLTLPVLAYLERFEQGADDFSAIGLPEFNPEKYTIVRRDANHAIRFVEDSERKRYVIKELSISRDELKEFRALAGHGCTSVITYQGIAIKKGTQAFVVSLLRPFHALGPLINHLGKLSPVQIHIIAYGVAKGLHFLHSNEIFHGGLTESTVFLTQAYEPVIVGFPFSPTAQIARKANAGGDVAALGCLIWALLIGRVLRKGDQDPRDRMYSALIHQCRDEDPENQITVEQVVVVLKGKLFKSAFKQDAGLFVRYVQSFGDELDPAWTRESSAYGSVTPVSVL